MSIKTQTGYSLECDFPGCTRKTWDLGEYAFWGDLSSAVEEWQDHDGLVTDDDRHFCYEHTEWDEESDERVPMEDTIASRVREANRRIEERIEHLGRRAELRLYDMVHHMNREHDRRLARQAREDRQRAIEHIARVYEVPTTILTRERGA